jgi:predicted amidophosphoribosyltransferase
VDGRPPPIRRKGIARDLVHHVKYGDRFDLATSMGQWMARRQALLHDDKRRHWPAGLR